MRAASSSASMRLQAGLLSHLHAEKVYRREDLAPWSHSMDRDLQQLTGAGFLQKLAQGLYYAPKQSTFGALPPDDKEVVGAFFA